MTTVVGSDTLFEFDDLWRLSSFTQNLQNADSIFELDASLPALGQGHEGANKTHFDFDDSLLADFAAPLGKGIETGLGDLDGPDDSPQNEQHPPQVQNSSGQGGVSNIWNLDLDAEHRIHEAKLFTWEDFNAQNPSRPVTAAYLSEAGPAAFDAALCSLRSAEENIGVLPQDIVLRSLCNLVLGRSSTLYQWSESKMQFEPTLPLAPASGLSPASYGSLNQDLVTFGSSMVQLRRFAEHGNKSRYSIPTMSALQSVVLSIIDAIEEQLARQVAKLRSLLQLQNLLGRPQKLVKLVQQFVGSSKGRSSCEELISSLSDQVRLEVAAGSEFGPLLQVLLARVSQPWLARLRAGAGLDDPLQISSSDKVESDALDSYALLNSADESMVNETRVALKMLKEHMLYPTADSLELVPHQHDASNMRAEAAPDSLNTGKDGASNSLDIALFEHSNSVSLNDPASVDDVAAHEQAFSHLSSLMSRSLDQKPADQADDVYENAKTILRSGVHEDGTKDMAPNDFTIETPFDRLRPLIQSQAMRLNRQLLCNLFRKSALIEHLRLHRSFHLLGDGDFVARLTKALFSDETQSAERRRGARPTTEVIGLKLGSAKEQRWPPASSELQLSLMGILTEVYRQSNPSTIQDTRQIASLPGELNFAVRELPEAEIELTLDANSIHALDFLRLQYNPPGLLAEIFTTDLVQNYDDIFRSLLPLLRLMHVASVLKRNVSERRLVSLARSEEVDVVTSFALHAHHFMSTVMNHFMDVAIDAPWRTFMVAMEQIDHGLPAQNSELPSSTNSTIGISTLRSLHKTCLERMRKGLFLKSKHAKLRDAFQQVMTVILTNAHTMSSSDDGFRERKQLAVSQLRESINAFCKLLAEQAERLPKASAKTGLEDVEVVKLLLGRLNWN